MKDILQLLEKSENMVDSASIENAVGQSRVLIQTVYMAIKGMLLAQEKQTENVQALLCLHDRVRELEKKLDEKESKNYYSDKTLNHSPELLTTTLSSKTLHYPPIPFLREIDCDGGRQPAEVFPITHDQWCLHDGKNRDFAIRVVGSEAACHVPLAIPGVDKKQFSLQLIVRDGRSMLSVRNLSESENLAILKKYHDGPFLNVGDVLYVGVSPIPAAASGQVEGEPARYKAKFIVD
eukprot:CAMPEP_0201516094 /NCGR_PEP_ID=MMETSP0161_2-20130828/7502_1 /ASSEMBLY_ACC=CAM_ASM_000251 /TAXON_ID=180227 /ORGANISM="Neoparamoeba aestuarina, Strain SoJaBio B1-5/56/2" /LENGTH=235 /DNA_ID=CAMNT_0047913109 /DNA_START=17 /DNA_END=721 /DNA_ORIENTATION=+